MWIFVNLGKVAKGGGMLILTLFCLFPFIKIFEYIDFCQHKDQIIIEQTTCEGFAWRDDNSYYDGVDYLNFSIDVTFKKKEVVGFNAHTLVFKGNKYIGYINSDFLGTSQRMKDNYTQSYFECNTVQKLYFHISHPTNTSWQNDEIFQELYYGDLKDFKFVTNIIYTDFSDGTTVGHSSVYYYDENGIIHFKDQKSDEERYYYYDNKGKKRYDR